MTMEVFGFKKKDFIDRVEIGGEQPSLSFAADSDIQIFI